MYGIFIVKVKNGSSKSTTNKTQRYVIIGLVCVAVLVALLVYQNIDSKAQTTVQNMSNPAKPEQAAQTAQSTYRTQTNTTQAINISLIEQDIHELANQARQSMGAQPIGYDPKLADIARAHSQDMATNQLLSHNLHYGDTLNHRYAFAGYNCQVQIGAYVYYRGNENVAVVTAQGNESQIAQRIVSTWLSSIADRGNIYDTEHRTEGIGVALIENKMAVYATEDFC